MASNVTTPIRSIFTSIKLLPSTRDLGFFHVTFLFFKTELFFPTSQFLQSAERKINVAPRSSIPAKPPLKFGEKIQIEVHRKLGKFDTHRLTLK